MIANVIQILTNEGQRLTDVLRANTPKVTGKTARSIGYNVTTTRDTATLQVTAKKYYRVVETGRRPTPDKKPSRAMIENISEWLRVLGKEEGLAWAIATKINQEGTRLWKAGGRKDVFSNVLTERHRDKLERTLQDAIADHYLQDVLIQLRREKLIKN
jgi:hypothetical protein